MPFLKADLCYMYMLLQVEAFQGAPGQPASPAVRSRSSGSCACFCRAVVDGPMAFVRVGTCGGLQPPASLGSLVVATEGSISVRWEWAEGP